MDSERDKKSYLHFNSSNECDTFISLIKVSNIFIIHKCCGGKGCCISKDNIDKANIIKNKFNYIKEIECCVCLENTNITTICNHSLCNNCFLQLSSKICPYCRSPI